MVRAAIYTRKSTEEGLDQDFNSLDAQCEARAAFIASQRGQGWRAVVQRYDDGGVSGGTMERPALKRLLADIDGGRIEMVVVYKIDRLTRSLADFARLVDRFDASGCSFVSVTQAFNTATSTGRLTLNVLLFFAQLEREVTAQHIRDKIAACKKKGLWMGGLAPLGYDRHPDPRMRELVVNETEAATVRTLFRLYEQEGCLRRVAEEVARQGIQWKCRVFAKGETRGGHPLTRGQIHYLLTNPVYRRKIRHKSAIHDGQHAAIIEDSLWERVEHRLQAASARRRGTVSEGAEARVDGCMTSPLTGKLVDETGDRLTPSHTGRRGKRLRYYVSARLLSGGAAQDPGGWRLPAPALERAVAGEISGHLEKLAARQAILAVPDAVRADRIAGRTAELAQSLRVDPASARPILAAARIAAGALSLDLDASAVAHRLGLGIDEIAPVALSIAASFQLRRRGVETRIIAGEREPRPDPTLVRQLAEAHRWVDEMKAGRKLTEVARAWGHSPSYLRTRAPLAFLSPRIQQAILDGSQPETLTLAVILRAGVPLDWQAQEHRFGFAQAGPLP
ncbi:MAG: recombinase family protein [Pseudomonadota bacterium]